MSIRCLVHTSILVAGLAGSPALAEVTKTPLKSAAAATNCLAPLKKLAVQDARRWNRFIFGLQGNSARSSLMKPSPSVPGAVAKNAQSCRAVSFAIDRLATGQTKSPNDLAGVFTPDGFLQRVNAVTAGKPLLFHFSIPGALGIGLPGCSVTANNSLGHHWSLEVTRENNATVGYMYAAFEGFYTLTDWLKGSGAARSNAYAGGKKLSLTQLTAWAKSLGTLLSLYRMNSAETIRMASSRFASLFGPSHSAMKFTAQMRVCNPKDSVIVKMATFPYKPAACELEVRKVMQQKANTCVGEICT